MSSAIRFLVLVTLILQLMTFLGPARGENIAGKTYYCRAWYAIDREKEWPEDGWPSKLAATAVHSKEGPIETTFGYLEQDPKALTAEEKGLPDFWRENQRRLAKQQYLESQGFSGGGGMQQMTQPTAGMAVAGLTGNTQQYQQMQGAMNNGTGYPIPPSGTDNYGRPYWIDAQGQMSYEPPQSGLGLGSAIQKGAAWAKWLM